VPDLVLRLPATPESVPVARHALDRLEGAVGPEQLENLELLVSEIVTNSIRHARGGKDVDIRIWLGHGAVRLEVEDRGPGFRLASGVREGNGGWGLKLVDLLSRRWGVRRGRQTTVWVEMDRYASPA
jgi:anti-sigma regulatory factor (Ser/Thr protein kinase)